MIVTVVEHMGRCAICTERQIFTFSPSGKLFEATTPQGTGAQAVRSTTMSDTH